MADGMESPSNADVVPRPPTAGGTPASGSRRRILKASLGTAPVLLTLASRPVLAGECVSGSAYGSTLHASHAPAPLSCAGKTPETWASITSWPDPYHKETKGGIDGYDATLYHCLTTGLNGTCFSGKTMIQVIRLQDDGDLKSCGRYVAAALLNARSNLTPVLTEANVRRMWNDYIAKGYYEATAGVQWSAPQIITYIKSTLV